MTGYVDEDEFGPLEPVDAAWREQNQHAHAVAEQVRRQRAQRDARRILAAEDAEQVAIPDLIPLDEFLARPLDPITHRIDGLWPRGGRVMLSAQWKAGKTTLRDNVVRSLVDGDDFLGRHPVHPIAGNVTLLDFELDEQTLQRWLGDQGYRHPERVQVLSMKGCASAFNILDDTLRARWAEQLRAAGTGVLVVDCLRPILDALGLDENRDAGRFLVHLDALAAEADAPEVFVVHHMGHGSERSRGDSRLRDWPDAEWRLVRDKDEDDPTLDDPHGPRYFSAYGRDVDHPQTELVYDNDTRHLSIGELAANRKEAGERRKLQAAIDAVLKVIETEPGIHKRGLRTACKRHGVSHNPSIDAAADLLEADGRIRITRVGQTHLHYLSEATVPAVPNRAHDTQGTTVSRASLSGTPRNGPTSTPTQPPDSGHTCPGCGWPADSLGHDTNCSTRRAS